MTIVRDVLYALALVVAVPLLAVKSWRTGKYRGDWGARFGRVGDGMPLRPTDPEGPRLMLHCVSVGELLSVRQLVDRLLAEHPRLRIVITTTTDTGTARARDLYGTPGHAKAGYERVEAYRYPLDFSFAVRRFLDHARPDLIALVELETWPNFLHIAQQRGIPAVIINGRLTARAAKRYAAIRPVTAGMFRRVKWFGIQTNTIANRFIALGAPRERVEIVPTLKYDTADLADRIAGAEALAAACGIAAEQRVFVGGSTGPGEEEPLLDAFMALRDAHPALRLALVPRKPETIPQVAEAIRRRGLRVVRRTERPDGKTGAVLSQNDVLLLDTMGELKKLYALASGVFVGRSLVPLGGSDMIEVAALAKPLCFGPHTANFAEAVELLTTARAAVVVQDGAALRETIGGWLSDPEAATELGRKARGVIAAQRGSTQRYVDKLLGFLPGGAAEGAVVRSGQSVGPSGLG